MNPHLRLARLSRRHPGMFRPHACYPAEPNYELPGDDVLIRMAGDDDVSFGTCPDCGAPTASFAPGLMRDIDALYRRATGAGYFEGSLEEFAFTVLHRLVQGDT